jgi:secreted trypsin-like serine protease
MTSGASNFRCGASIISGRAVLTAAHCPSGTSSTLAITGGHNIQVNEPTQQRRTIASSAYRLHANYNPSTLANDIAILITPTPVVETQFVRFSRLPHDFRNELFTGELVSIVGWGRTCVTCPGSDVLRGVQNYIITNEACRAIYGNTVTDQFFCMQTTGQRGTCPGDSGGPYTLPRPGPSDQLPFIQIGVHSFGASSAVGGCEAQRPSGAVRTTVFLDWITTNMIP